VCPTEVCAAARVGYPWRCTLAPSSPARLPSGGTMAHTVVTERRNVLDRMAPRGSQPLAVQCGHVRALHHIPWVHVRLTPQFRSFRTGVLHAVAKVQRVTIAV